MRLFLACAASLTLIAFSATACAQAGGDPLIGKHLYRLYCFVCHGIGGKTAGLLAKKLGLSPADLTSDKYRSMKTDALAKLIGDYVRKDDSPMPRWGDALPEENLANLTAYVLYLSKSYLGTRGYVRRGRATFGSACWRGLSASRWWI